MKPVIGGGQIGPGGKRVIPPQWDDLVETGLGTRLDSAAGNLIYNLDLKGVDVSNATEIGANADKIHFGYQIYHKYKLDGLFKLHVHWIQSQLEEPNWWSRWRVWRNGAAVGSWTEAAHVGNAFAYTSGTIMQISFFPTVDLSTLSGGALETSDFIDVEFTRDISNESGLFPEEDPVEGEVTVRAIDPHLQVDSAGSDLEYEKQ